MYHPGFQLCFLDFNLFFSPGVQIHVTAGVSRGKGQDLFLHAFDKSLQLIKAKKLKVPSMHAVVLGSDLNAQTKFENELRNFVMDRKIQDMVHFVNKTLTVAPYLASTDVLVQNSQVRFPVTARGGKRAEQAEFCLVQARAQTSA